MITQPPSHSAADVMAHDADRNLIRINGEMVDTSDDPSVTLLEVVRNRLGLHGTKLSCGRGECGACTVLVDGRPTVSCIHFAAAVEGDVTTIEGLAEESRDLREAFAEFGGFQCGYCTAGQVVHATALLRDLADYSGSDLEGFVRHRMSGNICRCTGYVGIVRAILETHSRRQAKKS